MPNKRDWTGIRQGSLTVLHESGRDKHGNVLWACKCDCGKTVLKSNNKLNGKVRSCSPSCGVVKSNKARARHGMWKSKEYACWRSMRSRCMSPEHRNYHRYGGRGVTVHPQWSGSDGFDAFYAYMGPAPATPRSSIERIDNNGNYEPGNVRWATPKEQSQNTSRSVRTLFRGELRTLSEIADIAGEKYHRVFQRFRRGLTGEDLVRRHKVGRKAKHKT